MAPAELVVKNPNCRKCGRRLVDQSDLWAGLCNNDEACERRSTALAEAVTSGECAPAPKGE